MSTVIRVKRHLTDDPVEALVLACKKRKTIETEEEDLYSTVLKFTGTVSDKDDKITTQTIETLHKTLNTKELYKPVTSVEDILSKKRKERRTHSESNRFKVISCFRANQHAATSTTIEDPKPITIVDVNDDREDISDSKSCDDKYVYDLYYSNVENDAEIDDLLIDNFLSVHAVSNNQLEFRSGEDSHDEYDCDEDDSNDENNWRNDYPDSDHSINEDDMKLMSRLKGMGLDDGYDLSSDTGEEDYANYGDVSSQDVALFGTKYSKFKSKILQELKDEDNNDDNDNDDDDDDGEDEDLY